MRASSRSAPPSRFAYVDQSRDCLRPTRRYSMRSPGESTGSWLATASCTAGPTWPASVSKGRPAEAGRTALRWRAQPGAAGQDPQVRRQRLVAGRTDERPRRRHTACARRGPVGFPGCVVVISHDRWFLDRIATHVLAFEGDSEVRWWRGTSAITKRTARSASGSMPISRTVCATSPCCASRAPNALPPLGDPWRLRWRRP